MLAKVTESSRQNRPDRHLSGPSPLRRGAVRPRKQEVPQADRQTDGGRLAGSGRFMERLVCRRLVDGMVVARCCGRMRLVIVPFGRPLIRYRRVARPRPPLGRRPRGGRVGRHRLHGLAADRGLAYGVDWERDEYVKVGVLTGSLLAVLLAVIILRSRNRTYGQLAVLQERDGDATRSHVAPAFTVENPEHRPLPLPTTKPTGRLGKITMQIFIDTPRTIDAEPDLRDRVEAVRPRSRSGSLVGFSRFRPRTSANHARRRPLSPWILRSLEAQPHVPDASGHGSCSSVHLGSAPARGPKRELSSERIVDAAIAIADGLAAVSIDEAAWRPHLATPTASPTACDKPDRRNQDKLENRRARSGGASPGHQRGLRTYR